MTVNHTINSLVIKEHHHRKTVKQDDVIFPLMALQTIFQLKVKPCKAYTQYEFFISTNIILISLWAFYPKTLGGKINLTHLNSNHQELTTINITAIEGEFDNTVGISFLPYVFPENSYLGISTSVKCNEILIMADPVLGQSYL